MSYRRLSLTILNMGSRGRSESVTSDRDPNDLELEVGGGVRAGSSAAAAAAAAAAVAPPRPPMELYLVKLNPACRVVWLYMLQHDIAHVLIDVDLVHKDKAPEFMQKYNHKEVPILVDGPVTVFEGPAILQYLAMQYTNHAGYGGNTMAVRMLVESLLSWANAELHRVVGFCYAYPHFLERYQLPTEEANEALVERGIKDLTKHLEALDSGYLSNKRYLTGDRVTIADSYVATVLLQAEWVGFSFRMWPRVESWMRRVRAQHNWAEVHHDHRDLVTELHATPFD